MLKRQLVNWFKNKGHGCSFVPDLGFKECCAKHDKDYEIGGDSHDRKAADRRFRECMQKKGTYKWSVKLYYQGVRIFGRYFWNKR